MVPVVTRAPNITNISCWKIAPKPLVYIDPRILLNYCTLISGETIQDWIERYFSDSGIFPKFRSLFHQSVPHCLRFYLCVSASPITSKIVRFFHSFVDSCIGTICHHKDFTGRVLLWENFISPRNNLFHTQKIFFSGKVHIPKWAPFAPNGTANQIAGNPGTTVVSIGHLTPWPQNPGYRTQVWDNGYIIIMRHRYWWCNLPMFFRVTSYSASELTLKDRGKTEHVQGPLLLTWFNFNPSMDK